MNKNYPVINRWNKNGVAMIDEIVAFIDQYLTDMSFTEEETLDFYPERFRRQLQFVQGILLEFDLVSNPRAKHLATYRYIKHAMVRPASLFSLYITKHEESFKRYQLDAYYEFEGLIPSYLHIREFICRYKNDAVCLKPFYDLVQSTPNNHSLFELLGQFIEGDIQINVRSIKGL